MCADWHGDASARPLSWLRYAALFSLPLTALNPGLNVTLGDCLLFAALGVDRNWRSQRIGALELTSWVLAAQIVVAGVINAFARGNVAVDLSTIQAWLLFAVVLPFGWRIAAGADPRDVLRAVYLGGIVSAVFAWLQALTQGFFLPNQAQYGMGLFGLRAMGLETNPNGQGLMMTWMVPIGVYLSATSRQRFAIGAWAASVVLVGGAGVLTFSKIAIVGIPVAAFAAVLLFARRAALGLIVLGLVAAFAAAVLAARDSWLWEAATFRLLAPESIETRYRGIWDAWRNIDEWLWWGVGAGRDTVYGDGATAIHNQWVGLAVQFGLPAVVAFLALLALVLYEGFRSIRSQSTVVCLVAFMLCEASMMAHPLYWTRAHYLPLILLLGCSRSWARGHFGNHLNERSA